MATSRTAARRKRNLAMRASSRPPAGPPPAGPAEPSDADVGWEEERPPLRPRRWPALAGMPLALAGLGLAAYLAVIHFEGAAPVCFATGSVINCTAVVTSPQSVIFGIPVPVYGLLFFAAMLPLQSPWAWRSASPWIRRARMAGVAVGVGMVVYLVYAELFLIGKICLDCTAVHVLTFALFCTTLFGTMATAPEPQYS